MKKIIIFILILSTVMLSADVYSMGNPKDNSNNPMNKRNTVTQNDELINKLGIFTFGIGQMLAISLGTSIISYIHAKLKSCYASGTLMGCAGGIFTIIKIGQFLDNTSE